MKNKLKNKAEILAPAGSMEAFVAGIRAGADAIYIGSKRFSARANATNFTQEEIEEAVKYAHKCGVKVYQAINTIVFDSELEELKKEIITSANIGIDAFIVQDLGVLSLVKKLIPNMPVHGSTQMSIHTAEGVQMAKEMGIDRVVLARELPKETIEELTQLGVDIEVFVHGALCTCVSGQCFMSGIIGSRSANRGQCAQPCRLPFSAKTNIDERRYDLSLKDMSYVEHINELVGFGVSSLKIEGRMKRPEYVAAAVSTCRNVLDGKEADLFTLKSVFSRSGFTDGYYKSELGKTMYGIRQKEDVVSADSVFPTLREIYRKEVKKATISFNLVVNPDENAVLTATDSNGNSIFVTGEISQIAIKSPLTLEKVEKQLSKLGDTIYTLDNITAKIGEGLTLQMSSINDMRRRACEAMDQIRIAKNTPKYEIFEDDTKFFKTMNIKPNSIRIEVENIKQLDGIDLSEIEKITVPLKKYSEFISFKEKIILKLPRYTTNEAKITQMLEKAKNVGFSHLEATNLSHIKLGQDLDFIVHGGFSLNLANSYSLEQVADLGLEDCMVSFELKFNDIGKMADYLPYGIIAYGKLPLMITANCPIKQSIGCEKCTGEIKDRTGRIFKVKCYSDCVEILNCDDLYLADKQDDFNLSFITLSFYEESPQEIAEIINAYKNNLSPKNNKITRGLYYRGVI